MSVMRQLMGIEEIGSLAQTKLTPLELGFLGSSMHFMGNNTIHLMPKTKNDQAASKKVTKGNVLGDSKSRWETVHFINHSHWRVKARISQKEGLEITQALCLETRNGFDNQKIYPLGFSVKRSYCKLGPFVSMVDGGFAVNALYNIRDTYLFMLQGIFFDNGTTTAQMIESQTTKNQLRVVTRFDSDSITIYDNRGSEIKPYLMPMQCTKLQCQPNLPCFEFTQNGVRCNINPPPSSKWIVSLTNHSPDHTKMIPSTKYFQLKTIQNPMYLVLQSQQSDNGTIKVSSSVSFTNQLAGRW